jgi:cytidine deaminase
MTREPSSLLAAAISARRAAYAPYSHFTVGAAVLSRDGRMFTGANVENASYGLSMCAERIAIYSAISAGVRLLEAVAVAGPEGVTVTPCGACRQVISEVNAGMKVIFSKGGQIQTIPIATLLPEAFTPQTLASAPPNRNAPVR